MSSTITDLPEEIWDQIIHSYLLHDRHLEPLSLVYKTFLSITNNHKQTLKFHQKQTLKLFKDYFIIYPRLFKRFPNLKHISFAQYNSNPILILHLIADSNCPIEIIDLSNHKQHPIRGFNLWPSSMLKGVKSFKMSLRTHFDSYILERIAYLFPNLEELDLSYPNNRLTYIQYNNDQRGDIGRGNPGLEMRRLKRVSFRHIYCICDWALALLCKNCPNLEAIAVKECNEVTPNGLLSSLQECKNLKSIRSDRMMLNLGFARSLVDIRVSKTYVSDANLRSIVEIDLQLKSFALSDCHGMTDVGITSFLEYYDSLDYLALKGINFLTDDSILSFVKYLKKATSLKLNRCEKLSDSTLFVLIENCPLLESLSMKNTRIGTGEKGCFRVSNPAIRSLNLSDNIRLGNVTMKEVVLACPNLETMRLKNCIGISRKSVGEVMRNCHGLRELRIDGCLRVTRLGLVSKGMRLERLVACSTRLNDRAMNNIGEMCPNLVSLEVLGCVRITSKGVLDVVHKCTKLKEIKSDQFKYSVNPYVYQWMDENKPFVRRSAGSYH